MVYKYEGEIKEELDYISFESLGNQNEMLKELKEVYRKAKAFDRIKDIHSDYSIGDAKCIEMIGDELERE